MNEIQGLDGNWIIVDYEVNSSQKSNELTGEIKRDK